MEQPRWMNNPRYQKAILKMSRMDPTRQAILDTVIADTAFAKEDMRNRLAMMKLAAQKTANEQSLELGEGRLELGERRLTFDKDRADAAYGMNQQRLGMDRDRYDIYSDDSDMAQKLGWANIGVSGLQGYNELQNKKRMEKRYKGLESLF